MPLQNILNYVAILAIKKCNFIRRSEPEIYEALTQQIPMQCNTHTKTF